jgi:hypothetical protein
MVCPTCGGTGKCSVCHGTGRQTCPTCNGSGSIQTTCPLCNGSGVFQGAVCPKCNGSGTVAVVCPQCNGVGDINCRNCGGSGICPTCHGTGQVPGALAAPVGVQVARRSVRSASGPRQSAFDPVNIVDFRQVFIDILAKNQPGMVVDSLDLTSQIQTVLTNFQYGQYVINAAQPTLIDEQDFTNDGPTTIQQQFSRTESVQLQETWSVTKGITLQSGLTFNIPAINIGGSASTTLTFSETQGKTESTSVSDTHTTVIPIAPNTITDISVTLFEYTVSVPWSANIQMRGQFLFTGHRDPDPSTHQTMHGSGPLGAVFQYYGVPNFTIVDSQTIVFQATGNYNGVHAQKWDWEIHSKPISAKTTQPKLVQKVEHVAESSPLVIHTSGLHKREAAFATAGATPQCPGTLLIDSTTQLQSTHLYSITNDGDDPITVAIAARLMDSRGSQISEGQQNVVVGGHSTVSGSLQAFLTVTYDVSGVVTLTASTEVSGGTTATAQGLCSFQVVSPERSEHERSKYQPKEKR